VVEIRSTIRAQLPRIEFGKIAKKILGAGYTLSLVICGDTLTKRLNREFRKKDYPANVLSFSLSKNEGEIFLNVKKARREAKALTIPWERRVTHLFVHGCFHLKGYKHGARMDVLERTFLKRFGFKY